MANNFDFNGKLFINSNGNILIGTSTDSGFKLRVNGTSFFDAPLSCFTGAGYITAATNDGTGSVNGFGYSFLINNIGHEIARITGNYQDSASGGTGGLGFFTRNAGTLVPQLTISGNGAATFSSSVTAGGNIRTSGGINAAFEAMASNSSSPQYRLGNTAGTQHWSVFQTLGAAGQQGNFGVFNAVNSTIPFTISTGGNVGIGTTTPGTLLNIDKSSNDNTITGTPSIIISNRASNSGTFMSGGIFNNPFRDISTSSITAGIWFENQNSPDAGALAKQSAIVFGAQSYDSGFNIPIERMRIAANGNVGIGTTDPFARLHVRDSDILNGTIAIGHNSFPGLLFANAGSGEFRIDNRGSFNGFITFYPNGQASTVGSEAMRINSSGNVGIGTTSPVNRIQANYSPEAISALTATAGTAATNWNRNAGVLISGASISNAIAIGVSGTANDRKAWIQSGHPDSAADSLGIISLNPLGGNVGIGTSAPSEKLHVDGSALVTFNNSFQSTNSVGNKAILARVSPTSGIVNYAEYATAANLNGFVIGSDDARVKGNITGDSLEFITNTSTRMTILSSGNVGINTTVPGSTLHVIGDVLIQTGSLGVGVNPNATDGRIDASNDIVAFSTSDRRLKENITPITNALEKVRSLTGVEFDWREETKSVHGYEGHDVGVIAQDVQAVLPEAVRTNDSGYLSVRYEKMIALLVEANKELADRVEQLEKLIK